MSEERQEAWHLDKRVPIALIAAIVMQTMGAIWWAASVTQGMYSSTARIDRLYEQMDAMREDAVRQAVQLGRIEEQINGARADIGRLVRALDAGTD